jgi:hypothetical protein
MAITRQDLRDFNCFVDSVLDNGGADSIVELARQWEARRREIEIPINIEIDRETARWLADAFPEMHDRQRLQKALDRRGGLTTAELLSKLASTAKEAPKDDSLHRGMGQGS